MRFFLEVAAHESAHHALAVEQNLSHGTRVLRRILVSDIILCKQRADVFRIADNRHEFSLFVLIRCGAPFVSFYEHHAAHKLRYLVFKIAYRTGRKTVDRGDDKETEPDRECEHGASALLTRKIAERKLDYFFHSYSPSFESALSGDILSAAETG
jgi:hypothetical protein